MKPYPQKWIDAIVMSGADYAEDILDKLAELGALKEPPKPREFIMCSSCFVCIDNERLLHKDSRCQKPFIKVREVLEDEE